jgi:hypothetical protein
MNYFGVTFYEMTGEQIAQWNMDNNRPDRFKMDLFPFVIKNKKEGGYIITEADACFQFFNDPEFLSEEQKAKKYILFEVSTTDNMLSEEISQGGTFDFLEMICFIDHWEKIKDNILIHEYNNRVTIASDQFFVTKTTTSHDSYTGEHDYDIELVGYLDREAKLIEI